MRHDERRVGTFSWPRPGTQTWPPVGTFSWPRTARAPFESRSNLLPFECWPAIHTSDGSGVNVHMSTVGPHAPPEQKVTQRRRYDAAPARAICGMSERCRAGTQHATVACMLRVGSVVMNVSTSNGLLRSGPTPSGMRVNLTIRRSLCRSTGQAHEYTLTRETGLISTCGPPTKQNNWPRWTVSSPSAHRGSIGNTQTMPTLSSWLTRREPVLCHRHQPLVCCARSSQDKS